jgi:hypothetical protein
LDYQALFERILHAVDTTAYLTPTLQVAPRQREAMAEIQGLIQSADFNADVTRRIILTAHKGGRIDKVMMLSALHVVAAHPKVGDFEEAARLVGEQEFAALEQGGPNLQANLASVDRHRGVLAFVRGHHGVALDYFTRSLERERTAENLGNVMATLLALGESTEARELLSQVRRAMPPELVHELDNQISNDPDLALLRSEAS